MWDFHNDALSSLLSYGTGLLFLVLSKKVDLLSKYPVIIIIIIIIIISINFVK